MKKNYFISCSPHTKNYPLALIFIHQVLTNNILVDVFTSYVDDRFVLTLYAHTQTIGTIPLIAKSTRLAKSL